MNLLIWPFVNFYDIYQSDVWIVFFILKMVMDSHVNFFSGCLLKDLIQKAYIEKVVVNSSHSFGSKGLVPLFEQK